MTIKKRTDLGRPLTWSELDDNFSQVDSLVSAASASVEAATTQAQAAGNFAASAVDSANQAANYASQIQQSSEQISQNSNNIDSINTSLNSKASSGSNTDITSLSGLTTALSIAQGGTGASTPLAGRSSLGAAASGDNSDITSLNTVKTINLDGNTLSYTTTQTSTQNKSGVVLSMSQGLNEASFGNESIGIGAAVFHNFTRPSDPTTVIGAGALIGGYGARPWIASTGEYTDHSSGAIHFITAASVTNTDQSTLVRVTVTPAGKDTNNRIAAATFGSEGDLIVSTAYDSRSYANPWVENRGKGLVVVRSGINNEPHFFNYGDATQAVNIRMIIPGGIEGTPAATPANKSTFVTMSGHDGTVFQGASAAIKLNSQSAFTPTSRATEISFETTGVGSTTRSGRWIIGASGNLAPFTDNSYSLGTAALRATALYAVNGTIQTSDARLKSSVRPFTDAEIKAASMISKEVGFFSWIEKQKEEGDDAREHCGLTVQKAIEIMTECGLEPMHYGFICHDEWAASKVVDHYDEEENPVYKKIPAGDRYSFRYDQLNLFIVRGIEARLSLLESK